MQILQIIARAWRIPLLGVALMVFGHSAADSFFRGTTFGDWLYTISEGPFSQFNILYCGEHVELCAVAQVAYASLLGTAAYGSFSLLRPSARKIGIVSTWTFSIIGILICFLFPRQLRSPDELFSILENIGMESTFDVLNALVPTDFYYKYKRPFTVKEWKDHRPLSPEAFFLPDATPCYYIYLVCEFALHDEAALAMSPSGKAEGLIGLFFDGEGRFVGVESVEIHDSLFSDFKSDFSTRKEKWMSHLLGTEGFKRLEGMVY